MTRSEQDYTEAIQQHIRRQPFPALLGMEIVSSGEGECEIHLQKKDSLMRTIGIFNGGAILALCDTCSGYAVSTMNKGADVLVTTDIHTNFLKKASGEKLIARAKVIKYGRTLAIAQVEIFDIEDEKEHLCTIATATYMKIQ